MIIPPHDLHIYQRPKAGTALLKQLTVYNYRHSINAIGGYDTASFDIALRSIDESQQFLDQFIGCMVRIFVDDPFAFIWEGFINRMTFNAGGTQYTISLDEMANRLNVQYVTAAASPQPTIQTAVNDTDSQAIFGIKTEHIDLGFQGAAGTSITDIMNTRLNQKAWPKTSRISQQGASGLLHIECLGFFHTLEWEVYRNAVGGLVAIGTQMANLIAAAANGTTFFDNGDTTGIATNARTVNVSKVRGDSIWDNIREGAEWGDSAFQYYVVGIAPTSFSLGTRAFYYRAFNSTIVYTARQSDGLIIRNLYGQKIDPWRVQPDNGVRINDMLIGWDGIGSNPTETWISSVNYDANRQVAIWSGDDNISAEGALDFRNWNKKTGKRFGALRRVT